MAVGRLSISSFMENRTNSSTTDICWGIPVIAPGTQPVCDNDVLLRIGSVTQYLD